MSGLRVVRRREAFRAACRDARAAGGTLGLVPTMGALHAGHRSLLARATAECDVVAMSIFVNPLQFGEAEDLAAYPRTPEADLAVAEAEGCDMAFLPDEAEMYPAGPPAVTVDPGPLGDRLEGAVRPGHFRGVLTLVAKLFALAGECRAYFGEKDAQQLALVRRMAEALDLPVALVGCPTVREPDGLALSSRNARLTTDERAAAPALAEGLAAAGRLLAGGEARAEALRAAVLARARDEPLIRLDYAAIVDERTWDEPSVVHRPALALVAARFVQSRTRLIDNRRLVP